MIFSYSLSFPLESLQRRYMTDASTLAGLKVLGSLRREMTDRRTVRTFWVGFHLSHGSSPLWGSSTGGCRIEMQRSPFYNKTSNIRRWQAWKWGLWGGTWPIGGSCGHSLLKWETTQFQRPSKTLARPPSAGVKRGNNKKCLFMNFEKTLFFIA